MKTFIRAVEVWVPSTDRSMLEFGGGLYGTATRFAALSRTLCFGRGEGLPGQAWEQGRPIILKAFDGSYFRRTAAAHAEGITCGIALPIFAGDFLTSVLVIFCGDDEAHAGAIELWHNDPAASSDMTLVDGYYGTTAETFEFMSRRTTIRRGNGLPGMAWESGTPVFFEDLGKAARFLRADTAQKVGINRGFAIPCAVQKAENHVVLEILPDTTRAVYLSRIHLHESGVCEQIARIAGTGKPLPKIDTLTRPFWDLAKDHKLAVQVCHACGDRHFPASPVCPPPSAV